jgi:hypothetical protein
MPSKNFFSSRPSVHCFFEATELTSSDSELTRTKSTAKFEGQNELKYLFFFNAPTETEPLVVMFNSSRVIGKARYVKPFRFLLNTASKLGPHTRMNRGTCPGAEL